MAHRAATDEICVTGGMGNAPSSKRRGLVRVSACCLLAPKDLACHVCREPYITRGERCSLFTCGSQNKQGKRIVTGAFRKACAKFDFITERCLSQSMKLAAVPRKVASLTRYHSKTQYRQILLLRFRKVTAAPVATSIMPIITMLTAPVSGGPTSFSVTVTMHSAT